MDLECITFSNVGLQQTAITSKNREKHLSRVTEHAATLLQRPNVIAAFLCELGDNMHGAGPWFQQRFQATLQNLLPNSPLQYQWTGELLCVARESISLQATHIAAGCSAPKQRWRYIQVVDIHLGGRPVKVYHTHLTSSKKYALTPAAKREAWERCALDAARFSNKHGFIVGGDLNTEPFWLTSVMEKNRELFFRQQRHPRMIFSPAHQPKRGDFAVAWLNNAVSPVDAPLVQADPTHDTVFLSWPRLQPNDDARRPQVVLARDRGAHQSPAEPPPEPQPQPEPEQSSRRPHTAYDGDESAERQMPWEASDQRSRGASKRGVTAMVATATAAVTASLTAAFQNTPAQSSFDTPHGITSECRQRTRVVEPRDEGRPRHNPRRSRPY